MPSDRLCGSFLSICYAAAATHSANSCRKSCTRHLASSEVQGEGQAELGTRAICELHRAVQAAWILDDADAEASSTEGDGGEAAQEAASTAAEDLPAEQSMHDTDGMLDGSLVRLGPAASYQMGAWGHVLSDRRKREAAAREAASAAAEDLPAEQGMHDTDMLDGSMVRLQPAKLIHMLCMAPVAG